MDIKAPESNAAVAAVNAQLLEDAREVAGRDGSHESPRSPRRMP